MRPAPRRCSPSSSQLGTHQRDVSTPGGLTLMGVRLYNPTVGRFLQTDPVKGGSANDYDYAMQDPINNFDLDGRMCWSWGSCEKAVKKHWRGIAQIVLAGGCIVASAGACLVASLVVVAASNVHHSGGNWSFDKTGFAIDAGLAVSGAFAARRGSWLLVGIGFRARG